MNDRDSIILNVHTKEDLKKLENNNNIKYININLSNPDRDIIAYFIKNGKDYSYSDITMSKNGYIYVDYETFIQSEAKIDRLLKKMPEDLSSLEKARYLYLQLGELLGYDINTLPEKNEDYDYYFVNQLNNIWFSLNTAKGINSSITKIYLYLCSLCNIKNELVIDNNYGYKMNQVTIDEQESFVVDLTKDLPNIEAHFRTKYFGVYNDDLKMDQKLHYVEDNYNDLKLDALLKKINYKDENILGNILYISQDILDIRQIKPIELSIIYDSLFQKYFPGNVIKIHNLYLNDLYKHKEHFLLLSDNKRFYSYNYRTNSFWEITKEDLLKELDSKRIGIYQNEFIPQIGHHPQK